MPAVSVFRIRAARALSRIAAAALLFSAAPAFAQLEGTTEERYAECLALTNSNPDLALERAAQWRAIGGGALARHCGAIAMIAIGAERNAAKELTAIGVEGGGLTDPDRAAALTLAGELWVRLDQPQLAVRSFAAAVEIGGVTRRVSIGSARAHAMAGDWTDAAAALDTTIERDPSDVEALTLRAAARRASGDIEGALRDATRATEYAPEIALGWFERGAAERALGQIDAARESWLQASLLDPDGAAGELARRNLQREALEQ